MLSNIEQQIKEKIEKIGVPLKEWDINIYRGILTGYNEAFIIDEKTKNELVEKSGSTDLSEIIRPILRGRDIQKYKINYSELYLLNSHNGVKEKKIMGIDVENNYPEIYKYFSQFLPQIEQRSDKGNHWTNLRNCAYLEEFEKPKIIYPNMTKFMPFFLDIKGEFFTNQKCFIITGNNIAFLTAFFNSSLFKFCFKDNFPELQGGTRELSKIFFDKISVIKIKDSDNQIFEEKIIRIQELKKDNKNTKSLEIEIDEIIFKMYNLNDEEIEKIGFIEIS